MCGGGGGGGGGQGEGEREGGEALGTLKFLRVAFGISKTGFMCIKLK